MKTIFCRSSRNLSMYCSTGCPGESVRSVCRGWRACCGWSGACDCAEGLIVGAMKATAEKATTTASGTRSDAARQPFLTRPGGGEFFPRVQTKLTVNKPGDKFEQEADKTADKVMRMATPGADKVQPQAENKVQKAPADEHKVQRR